MVLPTTLIIYDFALALDGGTTALIATDETGQDHVVTLVQHRFVDQNPSPTRLPGRLYFNGDLIPIRSERETCLLALLRAAKIQYTEPLQDEGESFRLSQLEDDIRELTAAVVNFVESDDYLRWAERVEHATDPTRYTVWFAWDEGTLNQVAVRLGRVLGIGIKAARESLHSGTPLAKEVTALEVLELARRYSTEGLSLRIEPAFHWQLLEKT